MNEEQRKKIRFRTIKRAISLSMAIAFGERVPSNIIRQRIRICYQCDKLRYKGEYNAMRCNACNCPLNKNRRLVNLANYKETKRYGCHHPNGSKWKGL